MLDSSDDLRDDDLRDDDLRTALRGLTADQPPQPGDRLPRVRARAARVRRTRTAGTALAVVAVAALAVPVVHAAVRPGPTVAATSVPATDWPDRSRAADRPVAEGALAEWVRRSDGSEHGSDARWLFRGAVPTGSGPVRYVAAFVSSQDGRQVVVVARAERDQVDADGRPDPGGDEGDSPWVLTSSPLPPPGGTVSTYLGGSDNPVLALADPAARSLAYETTPLPYASVALAQRLSERTGRLASPDGVFIATLGPLGGTVRLSVDSGASAPLGMPGDGGPVLREPGELAVPSTAEHHLTLSGTAAPEAEGRASGTGSRDDTGTPSGRWAVYARCYGGGSLAVRYRSATGRGDCDGQTHLMVGPRQLPTAAPATLLVTPGSLQAYRVGIYRLR